MSKHLKLKKWLTIDDAAKYLSISLGEELCGADILQFSLDGYLKLSVIFGGFQEAKKAKFFFMNSCYEMENIPRPKLTIYSDGRAAIMKYSDNQLPDYYQESMQTDEEVLILDDGYESSYDLPMIGNEIVLVQNEHRKRLGLEPVKGQYGFDTEGGVFVSLGANTFQLQRQIEVDGKRYHRPAMELPNGSTFVVRVDALKEFEAHILEDEIPKEKTASIDEEIKNPMQRKAVAKLIGKLVLKSYPLAKKDGLLAHGLIEAVKNETEVSQEVVSTWLELAADVLKK